MKARRGGGDNGFSLIELMIALFIFAVGILGVATMQLRAMGTNADAANISEATFLAESRAEELFALDFNHPALVDTNGNGAVGLNDATALTADYALGPVNGFYNVFWNVRNDATSKTIRVIVRWNRSGRLRTDATVTIVKLSI